MYQIKIRIDFEREMNMSTRPGAGDINGASTHPVRNLLKTQQMLSKKMHREGRVQVSGNCIMPT